MAETLRDLVVSLSLNSDNFSANIKSLNAQLKEADSAFKAASAGVTGFENTVAGAEAKLQTLQQKFQLQQQAVQQYEQALEKAQQKLQGSVEAHDKLAGKLEEAKQRHADLGQQIERLSTDLEQAEQAGMQNTAAYQEMQAQLEALKQQYAESGQEVQRLEQQLDRSERTMQRNADGVTRASTNLNNARAALSATGAQIEQTRSRLEQLRSGWLNAAEGIAAFGEKAQKAGQAMQQAGKELSKYSAAVAAAGAAAVKTFASYDDAIRQVYATMGLSEAENAAEMEALSAAAQEMGATTRYSASEAASALNYLALAGYDADQAIGALPTVLNLAQAGGIDLASASDMVTDSMSALHLEMEDMPKFADQMAKAAQKSNTSVAQLGEGILKIGGTAANLKNGTVELNTALGILADNGIKGSEGGTHLRNVLLSLQNPTDDAAAQLDAFGVKVYDAQGNMRGLEEIFGDLDKAMHGMTQQAKDAAISAIFNKTDLTAVNALLANNGERWRELSGEIANAEGAASGMADMMEGGIGGAFRSLKSAVEGLAIAFGETLAPTVQAIAERITEYVRKFTELDEGTKRTIVTIGAVVAVAGPLLLILGKVVSAVGTVAIAVSKGMKALAGAKTAIAGLTGALNVSAVAFAGVAAAAVYGAYKLIDWATGAKAAREAQARLNETVKEWNENVTTAYEKSKGLSAFGLTEDMFKVSSSAEEASTWLEDTIKTWTDGAKETDEILADTVKGFTDDTDKIRGSLSGLQGMGSVGDLDGDLTKLDEIDAEVESILKKRQNGYLTDVDKDRLQQLIDQRDAIKIKYQLVSDVGDAFGEITEGVESAMSRGADGGKVWADAYSAASQGMQSFADSLNQEYDAQYKVIAAMDEGAEKEKALGDLQQWYTEQKIAGEKAYADTLSQTAQQTGVFEEGGQYDGALQGIEAVKTAMDQLAQAMTPEETAAATDALNSALEGLDESQVVEVTSALVTMGESGAEMSESMTGALDALAGIKELMSGGGDLFSGFDSLNSLFGEGLDSEVLEIHAQLGTDALSSQYDAWAAGEHADIIPPLQPEPLDAATIPIDGVALVDGEIKTIDPTTGELTDTGYRVGVDGNIEHVDPTTGEVTDSGYRVGVDGELEKVDPETGKITNTGFAFGVNGKLQQVDPTTGALSDAGFLMGVDGQLLTVDPYTGQLEDNGYRMGVNGEILKVDPETGELSDTGFRMPLDAAIKHVDPTTGELTDSSYRFDVDGSLKAVDPKTGALSDTGFKMGVDGALHGVDPSTGELTDTEYRIDTDGRLVEVDPTTGHLTDTGYRFPVGATISDVTVPPELTVPELTTTVRVTDVSLDGNTTYNGARGAGLDALFDKNAGAVTENRAAGTPLAGISESDAEAVNHYADAVRNYNAALTSGEGTVAAIDQLSKAVPGGASMFAEWADAGDRAAESAKYLSTGLQKVAEGTITQEEASGLKDYIDDLTAIGEYDPDALEPIANAMQEMGTASGTVFEGVDATGLQQVLQTAAEQIDPSAFASAGQQAAESVVEGMGSADATGSAQGVVDGFVDTVEAGTGAAGAAGASVGEAGVEGVASGAQTESPSKATIDVGQNVIAGLVQGMRNLGQVQAAGAAAGQAAINAVRASAGGSTLYSVGLQIMSGLASGIRSGASGVVTAMREAVAAAVAAAKASLQINSPSKVFENEVGAMAMKGFGAGILDETRNQARIIENAARYLADRAQVAVAGGGSSRNTYNQQSSVSFSGSTFIVRSDSDVRSIAEGIAELTKNTQRGTGGLAARRV